MDGVSRVQWSQMTFERSACNVRGQTLSSSYLNDAWCLHFSQWKPLKLPETRFRWKVGWGPYLLRSHSLWSDLTLSIFSPKAGQKILHKLSKFQRDAPGCLVAISGKNSWMFFLDGGVSPPAPHPARSMIKRTSSTEPVENLRPCHALPFIKRTTGSFKVKCVDIAMRRGNKQQT